MPYKRPLPHHQGPVQVVLAGITARELIPDEAAASKMIWLAVRLAQSRRIRLHAYALLKNEAHFLVYSPDAVSLSAYVRELKKAYARYRRRQAAAAGPWFAGRYRCRPLLGPSDVLRCTQWMDRLAYGLPSGVAGLGRSSHAVFAFGESDGAGLVPEKAYLDLGPSDRDRQACYRALYELGLALAGPRVSLVSPGAVPAAVSAA